MVWIDLPLLKFLVDIAGKLGSLAGLLPKQRAKAKLADAGITYSEDSFFERVERGDREAVRLFLKAGMRADAPDKSGCSALSYALQNHDAEMIITLRRGGANLDAPTFGLGHTALAWQASQGRLNDMCALLSAGAAVDGRCTDGGTALKEAAYAGGTDAVRLLLKAGADVNAADHSGETALMIAARFRRIKELQVLIAAGAEVNLKDNDGVTALMLSGGRREIARLLVEAGADVEARDNHGRSTLEWFEEWGHPRPEAERILQELRVLAAARPVRTQSVS